MVDGSLAVDEIAALGSRGFFGRSTFLGRALAQEVAACAQDLERRGVLRPAGVRRGADHQLDAQVRGDAITWLDSAVAEPALQRAMARFEALRVGLNEGAWLGLRRTELQLAHYGATGAAYERHRDAFPGDDNRRITAIVYLNEHWAPEHGGRLRLHVDPPLDVEPRLDTLVVFRSELIEHEVHPSFAPRFALTAWYSAR